MCKMCEAETSDRFKDFDLDLTYNGMAEKYLSSGETVEQAAFLSGFKLAASMVDTALEESGASYGQRIAADKLEEIGLMLVAEGASVTLVPHVKSWLENLLDAFQDERFAFVGNPPVTAEEEETFPQDDRGYTYGSYLDDVQEDEDDDYDRCGNDGCVICYG